MVSALAERPRSIKPEKTWVYIKDFDVAKKAVNYIEKYCAQSFYNANNEKEFGKLAFDCETFKTTKTRFPRAVWNGETWDGEMRLFQVGISPLIDEFQYKDRQFLFDAQALGYPFFTAAFKDIFEEVDLIMHRAQFDAGFLSTLGINPKHMICTLIMSRMIDAGDKSERHSLADLYDRTFYTNPELFVDLSGYTLTEYHRRKKTQQNFDWSGTLTRTNLQYGADDVRMLFYAESYLWDRVESHVATETQERGLLNICNLEFSLIPVFVRMEQSGVKVDVEKHKNEVIPFVKQMLKEARDTLLSMPQFRRYKPAGIKSEIFLRACIPHALDSNVLEVTDDKGVTKNLTLTSQVKSLILDNTNLEYRDVLVGGKRQSAGDRIEIAIRSSKVSKKEILKIVRRLLPRDDWETEPTDIINLNSWKQLGPAINKAFEAAGEKIRLPFNEKGNAKTDAETLQGMIDKYGESKCLPIVYFSHYTEARGFNSKWGSGLLRHITTRGYIHTNWSQLNTETGRSTASDPPLHQVPNNKEMFAYSLKPVKASEFIRSLIIAEEGNVFIDADFSQIEPRYTAQITGDERMVDMFNAGQDMHQTTAAVIFGVPYEEVTKPQRADGKQTNLAAQYDMGYKKLAHKQLFRTKGETDWTKNKYAEAKRIMNAFKNSYAGLEKFKMRVHKRLRKKLETAGSIVPFMRKRDIFGAKVPIALLQDKFGRIRKWCIGKDQYRQWPTEKLDIDYAPDGEDPRYYYNECKKLLGNVCRQGYNFLVQGGCASIHKYGTLYVARALDKAFEEHPKWNKRVHGIKLTVHDELLIEVPEELAIKALKIVKREMQRAADLAITDVPLEIHAAIGKTWYEASSDK